jgi:multidrug efflux pump subunit AcrA (membrane-fusion protein)
MKKKIALAVVGIVAVVATHRGIKARQIRAMIKSGEGFTMPAETVSATEVKQETWESLVPAVGSVSAVQGVELRAELAGTVREIAFESGGTAAKGQVLVRLDTSSEHAQLRAAEAQSELARRNLERARDLHSQGVIAQSDLDATEAAQSGTIGQVDIARATIDKKTIRAPFAGRLGIRSVNLASSSTPAIRSSPSTRSIRFTSISTFRSNSWPTSSGPWRSAWSPMRRPDASSPGRSRRSIRRSTYRRGTSKCRRPSRTPEASCDRGCSRA